MTPAAGIPVISAITAMVVVVAVRRTCLKYFVGNIGLGRPSSIVISAMMKS
jgi:hypothetical protein